MGGKGEMEGELVMMSTLNKLKWPLNDKILPLRNAHVTVKVNGCLQEKFQLLILGQLWEN